MNFEITQKTPAQRAELNKFLGNVPILTELPDADTEKAGQVFIMQDTGRRWVYNDGRWAGLPVGEPWPEVGYKELSFSFGRSGASIIELKVRLNDLGIDVGNLLAPLSAEAEYVFLPSTDLANDTEVLVGQGSIEDLFRYDANTDDGSLVGKGLIIRTLLDGNPQTNYSGYQRLFVSVFKYPPTN